MQAKKFIIDERSKKKLEETSTAVLALFFIVCTIEMIIKMIVTHKILSILGELIILFSITFTFLIVHRLDKNYSPRLPRKNNGEQLNPEKTKKVKMERMLTYVKESILTAIGLVIVWIVLDYFLQKQNITWNINYFISKLIDIIVVFIVYFTIDSITKEQSIKRYNKWDEKQDK